MIFWFDEADWTARARRSSNTNCSINSRFRARNTTSFSKIPSARQSREKEPWALHHWDMELATGVGVQLQLEFKLQLLTEAAPSSDGCVCLMQKAALGIFCFSILFPLFTLPVLTPFALRYTLLLLQSFLLYILLKQDRESHTYTSVTASKICHCSERLWLTQFLQSSPDPATCSQSPG